MKKFTGNWVLLDTLDIAVNCLMEDRAGNIWIGTRGEGLRRMTGGRIEAFTSNDGIPEELVVTCLAQDRDGVIWVGAYNGVYRYSGRRFWGADTDDSLPGTFIRCICVDPEGRVIVAGDEEGVLRIENGKRHMLMSKTDLSGHRPLCVYADKTGRIWIGMAEGRLFRVENGQSEVIYASADPKAFRVWGMSEDAQGGMWIGNSHDGLAYYSHGTLQWLDKFSGPELSHVKLASLCCDRNGTVWIGTFNHGLFHFAGGELSEFKPGGGISYSEIPHIIEDSRGNVWVALLSSGLGRYEPSRVQIIADDRVEECMTRASDGACWWVTGDRLVKFDGSRREEYPMNAIPRTILEDKQGRIWVSFNDHAGAAMFESLDALKKGECRTFNYKDGLPSNDIWCFCQARNGRIWCGGSNGVAFYGGQNTWERVHEEELQRNVISTIFKDSRGALWFGGWAGLALYKYDGKELSYFEAEQGLLNRFIQCFAEDRDGRLWVGCVAGLSCYDGKRFTNHTRADGFCGRLAQRMCFDSRGVLWVATLGGGISRFDGKNFQKLTRQDGLPCNDITGVMEDTDGTMIISTYLGVCKYKPDRDSTCSVSIDEIDGGGLFMHPSRVSISANVSVVKIKYHGSSYGTRAMRYRHILEGHERNWSGSWDEEVRYSGLKPGKYVFKVVAINRDLAASREPAEVAIEIVSDPKDQVISELEAKVRERTEDLRRAKEDIEKVVGTMRDVLLVARPDKAIRLVNPAALTTLNYAEAELLNRSIEFVLAPEDHHLLHGLNRVKIGQAELLRDVETNLVRKDGSRVPVILSVSLMNTPDGRCAGLVCVAVDITERKRAEEERLMLEARVQHAQKLESLGVMAGGIAHDFNNLLAAVLGNAEMARSHIGEPDFLEEALSVIDVAARKAADLSGQMLAFTGFSPLGRKNIQISGFVADIAPLLSAAAGGKIRINYRLVPCTSPFKGEPGQIKDALVNLVTNSAEAIGNKPGEIDITTGEMECSQEYVDRADIAAGPAGIKYVFVEVKDNGCGMDAQTRKKMFDPFFTTKFIGRGLGLAACMGIVKGHRGLAVVSSAPGKGTTIRVLFPSIQDAVPAKVPQKANSTASKSG